MKKEKENIILVGAGGHCNACIDVIEQEGKYNILGLIDDDLSKIGTSILGYKILGNTDYIQEIIKECNNFLITIGQIKSSKLRIEKFDFIKKLGGSFPIIISPSSYISSHAKIEEGTIIMHEVVINASSHIGKNNIINTKALIEHDCTIGSHCHISTGSIINGTVNIDDCTFVGSGAIIANNVDITKNVIIASGSVIFKNIKIEGTYAGNPAKQIG